MGYFPPISEAPCNAVGRKGSKTYGSRDVDLSRKREAWHRLPNCISAEGPPLPRISPGTQPRQCMDVVIVTGVTGNAAFFFYVPYVLPPRGFAFMILHGSAYNYRTVTAYLRDILGVRCEGTLRSHRCMPGGDRGGGQLL